MKLQGTIRLALKQTEACSARENGKNHRHVKSKKFVAKEPYIVPGEEAQEDVFSETV